VPNTPARGTATTPSATKTATTPAAPAAPKHRTPKRVVHKHVTPAAKPHVVTPPPPPPATVVKPVTPVVPVTPPAVTPPPPPPPPAVKRTPQAPSQPGGKFGSEGET
jgi:hypothetical protein